MYFSELVIALLAIGGFNIAIAEAATMHWGVASSGFQHEGYFPDSNWMRYVQNGNNIADQYKNSVDFFHRYASDIALAKSIGVNTYRFSVEWARIEPTEGALDSAALAFYDDVVNTVIASGMTPMITLDHWVYPGWIMDNGAWDKQSTVEKWLNHAKTVVTRYAGRGVLWITINEPTEYISREQKYRGLNIIQQALMIANLIQVHRRAYDMIHQVDPGSMVSSNLAYEPPPLQLITDAEFFDHVTDKLDFIAIDYYYGLSLDNWSVAKALNGDVWDIQPQPDGLYYAMMSYHNKVPWLPFYIVENGMPTNNGVRTDGYSRSNHLRDHIYWLQRAAADGLTVIGYNYWSLTDNYEWGTYQPRFGLYQVDVLNDPTLTRNATDAVETYKQIIANNGVPDGYTPVMPPSLCNVAAGISACVGQLISLIHPHPITKSPTKSPTSWWQGLIPADQTNDVDNTVTAGSAAGIAVGTMAGFGLVGAAAVIMIRRRRTSTNGPDDVWSLRNSAVLAPPIASANPTFEANNSKV